VRDISNIKTYSTTVRDAFIPQKTFAFHCCICIELRDVASALRYPKETIYFVFLLSLDPDFCYEWSACMKDLSWWFYPVVVLFGNSIWMIIYSCWNWTKWELYLIKIHWHFYFLEYYEIRKIYKSMDMFEKAKVNWLYVLRWIFRNCGCNMTLVNYIGYFTQRSSSAQGDISISISTWNQPMWVDSA
jgi:hypothetical protein